MLRVLKHKHTQTQICLKSENKMKQENKMKRENKTKYGFILLRVCVHAKLLQSCLTHCDPVDCSPPGSSVHGDSPGKNTGVGCHALLQGLFLT